MMPWDRIEGWEKIADFVQRSEKWCRKWASNDIAKDMRLPVYRMGGMVCADRATLVSWQGRLQAAGYERRAER